MLIGLMAFLAAGATPQAACIPARVTPTAAEEAAGKPWYIAGDPIKVLGKTYTKYGLPRVLQPGEVRPFANYKGAILAIEAAPGATDDVLYVLTNFAGCEFQPYVKQG